MANTMTHTAFVGTKVAVQSRPAVSKPRGMSLRVNAKWAGNWLPGSKQPAYLEALPAAYGFVSTPCTCSITSMRLDRFARRSP